ncbi:MAG: YkgJ family cysteine cluster protein [Campylobacterales bacterium]|nr:YkgJ family cysteine cluster protein [Campylobacterales bacterium]
MLDKLIFKEGYDFGFDANECAKCNGFCCRGESGYIWINYNEIQRLSEHLGLSVDELAIKYLKRVKHRYSIIEKRLGEHDYTCIFFDQIQNRCGIYEARPNQCRTFPFWEQFKNQKNEVKQECPGVR